MANSMLGEFTPRMAQDVSTSKALKLFLSLSIECATIIGYQFKPLPYLTDELLQKIKELKIMKGK